MTGDTIEELQQTIDRLQEALKQPVLTKEDFKGNFADDEG
jgi:hypothetical protein